MYKVIKVFTDLQDDGYRYNIGDTYPRKGAKVSDKRIELLASSKNRQKTPLIEETKERPTPKKSEEPMAEEEPKPKTAGRKKKE